MKKVNIIGVPEHFNFPWKMSIESGDFAQAGIDLEWTDVPEGTGKMCQMLRDNQTDLAIILTEGIMKDIASGNPSVLVQEYVSSPLQWGIFVAADSAYQTIEDLRGKKVAISRYGSGSHLMPLVNAGQQGWSENEVNFEVVHTLEGAIEALQNGTADYFMWDRFMTQPIVDKKIFRRVGICPTPWQSFVLVGNRDFVQNNKPLVESLLEIINTTTAEFRIIPSIDRTISEVFEQKIENVQEWLSVTRWSQQQMSKAKFDQTMTDLQQYKIIDKALKYEDVIA
ncbi:MAG TPA: substrate-binding domain-containing protein [Flavobacterium sp.]|nr:substrate-binding domain-containing protein [Flavobacterium sp.]